MPPERLAPQRALPPYAYLPGRDPHPTRDPQGHSHDHDETPPPYTEPAQWRDAAEYLWGVDLYNHGYLWEAHEAWESLWHVAKRNPEQALYLQGLIQCAAACLKIRMLQPTGMQRLAALGLEKLTTVARAHRGPYMGLDIDAFALAFQAFIASAPSAIDGRPLLRLER
jgi:predicted metal-dependent hydrolase